MDDAELRSLVPHVLGVLVGRRADFATAEDAVQGGPPPGAGDVGG